MVAALPLVGIFGLLWLSDRVRARREVGRRLQITVTDAVHAALGAVAAPLVTRRSGGGWRVEMRVPAGRPDLAAALAAVAEEVLERATRASRRPFEIVLLPTEGIEHRRARSARPGASHQGRRAARRGRALRGRASC